MKLLFSCFALIAAITFTALGQVPPPGAQTQVYTFVEQPPHFPEGDQALHKFLADNIKYPEIALREGREGLVVLSFVVNEDGSRTEYQVLKSQGEALDNEAIRAVRSMPAWVAGKQNGRTVRVRYNLPVRFKLHSGSAQVQGPSITREKSSVQNRVERMPEFPGGPGPMLATSSTRRPSRGPWRGCDLSIDIELPRHSASIQADDPFHPDCYS